MQTTAGSITSTVYAHGFGSTRLSSYGSQIVTASDDCQICIYKVTDHQVDNSNRRIYEQDTAVLCVATDGDRILYGLDDYSAQMLVDGQSECILRCTLPVRAVALSKELCAVAGDDMLLQVFNFESQQITPLNGHDKSIKALEFNETGDMLAAASCDGSVYFYAATGQLKHKTSRLYQPVDPEDSVLQICWVKNLVAVPCDNCVKLIDGTSFQVVSVLQVGSPQVTVVDMSKDGQFMVCGTGKGVAQVWDLTTKQQVSSFQCTTAVTGVSWVQDKLVAMCLDNGQLLVWSDALNGSDAVIGQIQQTVESMLPRENKLQSGQVHSSQIQAHGSNNQPTETAMDEDDLFAGLDQDYDVEVPKPIKAVKRNVHDIQETFQPNSTPFQNGRRYLDFNMVGSIDVIESDSHCSTTIEFHDISNRPINFKTLAPYDMGCLTETGAVFASIEESEDKTNGVVVYKPFENWAGQLEWSQTLPEGEIIKCVALGNYIALVTDLYVRIITKGGVQVGMLCTVPNLVSATSFDNVLMMVYHDGSYKCQFYNIADRKTITTVLPLEQSDELVWIGFSDRGVPGIYDSNARCMAFNSKSNQWIPLLDTSVHSQGKTDRYWPVSFDSQKLSVVVCKGGDVYPGFPKPIITDLNLKIPLLPQIGDVNGTQQAAMVLEEQYMRSLAFVDGQMDATTVAQLDKNVLQLMQHAARASQIPRSLDLCKLLIMDKSVEMAYRLAQKLGLHAILPLIEQMVKDRQSQPTVAIEVDEEPVQAVVPQKPKVQAIQPKRRVIEEATPRRPSNLNDSVSPALVTTDQVVHMVPPPNPFKKKTGSSPPPKAASIYDQVFHVKPMPPVQHEDPASKKRKVQQSNISTFFGVTKAVDAPNALNSTGAIDKENEEVLPHVSSSGDTILS